MINIFIAVLALSAFVGAVFLWGRDSFKKKIYKESADDARKDANIANEPHKSRSNILKWMRDISDKS